MRRILIVIVGLVMLQACNSGSGGEEGVQNDGIKTVDTNGALNDSKTETLTDSTNNAIENKTRTDIQQRDTFTTQGQ